MAERLTTRDTDENVCRANCTISDRDAWHRLAEFEDAEEHGLLVNARADVSTFAKAMETTLRKHDDRPGWENETFEYLFSRLNDEWDELNESKDEQNFKSELIDIANFCMMLYCNITRKEAERKLSEDKP